MFNLRLRPYIISRYASFSLFFDWSFTLSLIGLLFTFHQFLPMYRSLIPSHGYCASHARTMSLLRFPHLLRFARTDHSFLLWTSCHITIPSLVVYGYLSC